MLRGRLDQHAALIHNVLVQRRAAMGLSQRDIAVRMGVSQPTISQFEKYGIDPHLTTIMRYAKALGLTIELGRDIE